MAAVYQIGPFVLEPAGRGLTRDGVSVPLGQRALAVLGVLAEAGGAPVAKEALLDRAWPGVTVEEGNLAVQVSALRKALGRTADGGERIVTLPRQGYRLVMDGAGAAAVPPVAGLPHVIVEPFETIGGGPEEDWFAAGVVADLATALSRFRSFAVVSRGAAGAAKSYVLRGSLRRAGARLRIVARLEEGASGALIWGETFEGGVEDVFAFQDRIAGTVAARAAPRIEAAEIARARQVWSGGLAPYELYLRAMPMLYSDAPDQSSEAVALLDAALAMDPDNPLYLSRACWALEHRISAGWPGTGAATQARCLELAERTLATGRGDARDIAHAAMSLLHVGHDYGRAIAVLRRAVDMNPNSTIVNIAAGIGALHCGTLEEAEAFLSRAVALGPDDPMAHIPLSGLGQVALIRGDAAGALEFTTRSMALSTRFDAVWWVRIGALVALGRMEAAREALGRLRALTPGVTLARIRAGQPRQDPARIAPLLEGLRAAGLPED